ncbi:unnamed protein product [Prorocentrum cordatum]|uniref:Transaldolase n=1 Tax=Prorocentrum cordatum TaxID=2364126 RepID=A0ABN9VLI4_9DINO|nr:unnamed protein product [Polarella glacialis]
MVQTFQRLKAQAVTDNIDLKTVIQNFATNHPEEAKEEGAKEAQPQPPAGAKHRRLTLGGTFAGMAAPEAGASTEEDEPSDDIVMLGRLHTSMTNIQKLVQKLDAPLSNNVAVWKGRATSMKEFYEGVDEVVRACSRDAGTNDLLSKVCSAGPLITFEVKYYNKMKETMDNIKAKINAEGLSDKVSAFMAGGPLRGAIESTPKGIYATLLEMGAQKEYLRTWWPVSVAAPGWSMRYEGEHDFAERIATVAMGKDVLKKIRRNVGEGADMILLRA